MTANGDFVNDMNSLDDDAAVLRVVGGETDVFSVLLSRHKDRILRIVKKHVPPNDVDDVSQDVFVRAYQSLGGYRKKGRFRAWLNRIAVRSCYDYLRRKYRSRELPMSCLSEGHQTWLEQVTANQSVAAFDASSRRNEARDILAWALDRISPEDRMVLELTYLEGYTAREAADLLGWSTANVKVRSHRSKKKLKRLLEKLMDAGKEIQ